LPFKTAAIKRVATKTFVFFTAIVLGIISSVFEAPVVSADVQGIDFIIEDIAMSPAEPVIGDNVDINVTVKNQGTVDANLSRVVCSVDSVVLSTKTIDSLDAGTSTTITYYWQATSGSHTIKATADSGDYIHESDENNNIKTFIMSTLAPDLTIQYISYSPTIPSKNDLVTFDITVTNQGTFISNPTNVKFYVDDSFKGSQDIGTINPGSTSTVSFEWYAPPGDHAVNAVVDEANIVVESNDNNNEYLLSISTALPDLTIQSITFTPEKPSENDTVVYTILVANQGTGRADSCYLAYYIDEQLQPYIKVDDLAASTVTQITVSVTASSDSQLFEAYIDIYRDVLESDETNNENTAHVSTVLPDLTVKDVIWTPSSAGVGDTVTFSAIIKNKGEGRAEASRASYSVSGDYSGYADIPAIEPGQEYTTKFQWTATHGAISFVFAADFDNRLNETNELNNYFKKSVPVILPDLYISSIDWSPKNPAIGDMVDISVVVGNQGGGQAGSYHIGYYLDDVLLTSERVSALPAGSTTTQNYTWLAQNGRHIFKVVADFNNHISESDNYNNDSSITIVPYMPDLAIGTVVWSSIDIQAGNEIAFNIDIENTGSLKSGVSRITYYVDEILVGYDDVGQIEAGSRETKTFTWFALEGLHTIDIVADSNRQVQEIDEENNSKHVNIPPPDLVTQKLSWTPEKFSIGDTVTFSATVRNQGNGRSRNTKITCYIDNTPLASKDTLEIEPANSVTYTFDWIAEFGQHDIRVSADTFNLVTETDETNNDIKAEFETLAADLIVEDVSWYMENPLINDEVIFTICVKNQGNDISDSCQLEYYIDNESSVFEEIDSIPVGETVTLTFITTLNAGPHEINTYIDTYDEVVELDETNNDGILEFSTIVPDLVVKSITLSPADAVPGDTITVTVKVENRGIDKALDAGISLSIGDSYLEYQTIEEIDVGAIVSTEFSWKAEAGSIDLNAFVDMDESVIESNESNNTKLRTIFLEKPEEDPTIPVKMASVTPSEQGFLTKWWWIILIVALLLGSAAFVSGLRAVKKR